jgi:hypothetical protein
MSFCVVRCLKSKYIQWYVGNTDMEVTSDATESLFFSPPDIPFTFTNHILFNLVI